MNSSARFLLSALLVSVLGVLLPRVAQSQVAVTAADPTSAPQGTISLDVTVSGSGFDSSAQVEFLVTGTTSPGGIIVKKVKVTGPKKLIATIDVAETAVIEKFDIQVSLSGGRKGKGTSLFAVLAKTKDPCAALNLDFPAFVYSANTTGIGESTIYVADATGQCSRPLVVRPEFSAGGTAFSYPIAGTSDVGRVVWGAGNGTTSVYTLTFRVSGTSVAVSAPVRIFEELTLGVMQVGLSKDGKTAYAAMVGVWDTANDPSRVVAIDIENAVASEVFAGPPGGSRIDNMTVNEDGTLFLSHFTGDITRSRLLRVEPPCGDVNCATAITTTDAGERLHYSPAVSLVDDRLVFSQPPKSSSNCWQIQVVSDLGGSVLTAGPARYGVSSSWMDAMILTEGIKPPSRKGKCESTGWITQIDPETGEETQLVRGRSPDGR